MLKQNVSALLLISFFTLGCATVNGSSNSPSNASSSIPSHDGYPAHWWTEVPRDSAPSWEILPQDAKDGEVILSKRNELGLLSNFAATPFIYHGKKYASLEGFWQAMLFPEGPQDARAKFPGLVWPHTRDEVEQMVAFDAKRAGEKAKENMKKMGIDWVTFEGKRFAYKSPTPDEHYRLILEATRAKLEQNPKVREVLLSTGNLKLRPDHTQDPAAPPEWRYFEIYEKLRDELNN